MFEYAIFIYKVVLYKIFSTAIKAFYVIIFLDINKLVAMATAPYDFKKAQNELPRRAKGSFSRRSH